MVTLALGLSAKQMLHLRLQQHVKASNFLCLLQLGFFNIVGLPLFKAMAELFEDSQPMLDGVLGNLKLWEAAAEAPA